MSTRARVLPPPTVGNAAVTRTHDTRPRPSIAESPEQRRQQYVSKQEGAAEEAELRIIQIQCKLDTQSFAADRTSTLGANLDLCRRVPKDGT
jgi:hypothetical protein